MKRRPMSSKMYDGKWKMYFFQIKQTFFTSAICHFTFNIALTVLSLLLLVNISSYGGNPLQVTAKPVVVKEEKPKLEKGLYAEIETNRGKILIKLEMEKTPLTVASFVGLAEGKIKNSAKPEGKPFYDSLKFHRVIANFMIQGGDPQGTGMGGPGYAFKDECFEDMQFTGPGILAMANAGPKTNGSQFFITHTATPWLNMKHTIFGNVIVGQDVVNAIKQGDMIIHVKIIRKGRAAKKFKAAKVFAELNK